MTKEPYFVVGGRYRNRLDWYEVLEIQGKKMKVRYETNGMEAILEMETQKRIINNIAIGERKSSYKRQEYIKESQTLEGSDENIRDFLLQFSFEELRSKKILHFRILQGRKFSLLTKDSVKPLIRLMKDKNIARLVYPPNAWYIDINGNFNNPESGEFTHGNIKDLSNKGEVFRNMNQIFNPYYDSE